MKPAPEGESCMQKLVLVLLALAAAMPVWAQSGGVRLLTPDEIEQREQRMKEDEAIRRRTDPRWLEIDSAFKRELERARQQYRRNHPLPPGSNNIMEDFSGQEEQERQQAEEPCPPNCR
jgi:hypothetical protein